MIESSASAQTNAPPSDGIRGTGSGMSFDIWDWTSPAQDLETFTTWVKDLQQLGVERVELSVPWKLLEPEPGLYDLSWLVERFGVCNRHGLGMRLRINSYYRDATPSWYQGAFWRDETGSTVTRPRVVSSLPSINDEIFWRSYGPLCTAIAKELRGKDVLYNAFIGPHAELKYGDWWTFDQPALELWKKSIQRPRPAWLVRVVGNTVDLPEKPVVPSVTNGLPDTASASRAFIAFREWTWREAVRRFELAIRQGDPNARLSAPLGESYRRESAHMSNLDYWGLSRGCSEVVHSFDFALHPGAGPQWHAAATIAAFRGISSLPVSFEFDSPDTMLTNGYTEDIQKTVALAAHKAGAKLKFANFSYQRRLPGSWPLLQFAAQITSKPMQQPHPRETSETMLLFLSKWANYSYRESTEWLHEAQFGWWKLLADLEIPTRIICEDNLHEDLDAYRGLILAFSPLDLLPELDRRAIEQLNVPVIADWLETPAEAPRAGIPLFLDHAETPRNLDNPTELKMALGYHYLSSNNSESIRLFSKRLLQ